MEITFAETAQFIQQEIDWFDKVVDTCLTLYFERESPFNSVYDHMPPQTGSNTSPYAQLIRNYQLGFEERLVLILAFIPHIKSQSLDVFQIKNPGIDKEFAEFGGIKDNQKSGFIPTLETACFILGGVHLETRFQFMHVFHKDHLLFKRGILDIDHEQEFGLQQKLTVSQEYLGLFCTGTRYLPQYSTKFPAKEITTPLEWDDLIVEPKVRDDLTRIKDWLLYSDIILNDWQLHSRLKAGYRVLFYGPPGTGKTLAATLLGKVTNRPVFCVDLSLVVSKYIGETEKNLGRLFDEAQHKDWILFFDEADALFGKRTQTRGANDRYANQEVAYLLQRIEDFPGLVILATNIQTNIDEAFSRRFQSMVYFPKPDKAIRRILWERMFRDVFELAEDVNLDELAEKYELSGGEMINVLRYCALEAAKRNEKYIEPHDIMVGVGKEYNKSNKTL